MKSGPLGKFAAAVCGSGGGGSLSNWQIRLTGGFWWRKFAVPDSIGFSSCDNCAEHKLRIVLSLILQRHTQ